MLQSAIGWLDVLCGANNIHTCVKWMSGGHWMKVVHAAEFSIGPVNMASHVFIWQTFPSQTCVYCW